MADDDPFGIDRPDKTMIMPAPRSGGRAPPGGTNTVSGPATRTPQAQSSTAKAPPLVLLSLADRNIILGATAPLLCYATELRHAPQPPNDSQIYTAMVNDIKQITEQLRSRGMSDSVLVTMRYMLCTFIDEMILNTPWGASSTWSGQPLLSFFHKEARGGVKFFEILKKLTDQPANYIDLLEFGFVCLNLGYMGQYRLQPNGAATISQLQENVYQTIRLTRDEDTPRLSKEVMPAVKAGNVLTEPRMIWLTATLCVAIVAITFVALLFNLNGKSDPVAIRASAMGVNLPQLVKKQRSELPVVDTSSWRELLARDLAAETIDIQRTAEGIQFTLFGNGLFNSGSAQLSNAPLVDRVIQAIKTLPSSALLITGHSDNIPIRTVQFPSNWKLSQSRAQSIADRVKTEITGKRIDVEGMAELKPLVANDSEANRAKNRRVEITVFLR